MQIKLTNDFHRTEAYVRVPTLDTELNRKQLRRLWATLCGHKDCLCSDIAGTRPSQVAQLSRDRAILRSPEHDRLD